MMMFDVCQGGEWPTIILTLAASEEKKSFLLIFLSLFSAAAFPAGNGLVYLIVLVEVS